MTATSGRFLTGPTMGHVIRMTMTGALGITFVFLVDAASLFWISTLGDPRLMAAIGFAFSIQFFTVSIGVGVMITATAIVARAIGGGDRALARRNAVGALILTVTAQALVAGLVIAFRHPLLALAGAIFRHRPAHDPDPDRNSGGQLHPDRHHCRIWRRIGGRVGRGNAVDRSGIRWAVFTVGGRLAGSSGRTLVQPNMTGCAAPIRMRYGLA